MTIPPQPPQFLPTISPLHHPRERERTLFPHTMYDPRTQFSHKHDHIYSQVGANKGTRLAQSDERWSNWSNDHQEVVQFRPNHHHQEPSSMEVDDDSGFCSPPLWKNSPSPSHPLLSHHITTTNRSISPNSRAQAIARGQRELMEMVKNMPESSYELSLKDLVEHHHRNIETQSPPQVGRVLSNSKNQDLYKRGVIGKLKREESKRNEKKMVRNESFENKGLFLNMVFPFSLQSKKKKKNNNFAGNSSGKVSPKPEVVKGGGERDWWKKKFTGSSDSDSSRTSINSGGTTTSSGGGSSSSGRSNSGGRKRNGLLTGCWTFFQSRRSNYVE